MTMMMAGRWKIASMIIAMLLSSAPRPAMAKHVTRLSTMFVTTTRHINQRRRRVSNRVRAVNGDERMGTMASTQTTDPSLDPQKPGTTKDHDRIQNVMSVVRAQHVTDVSLSLQTKLMPEQQNLDMDIDGSSRRTDGVRYEWRNRATSILETSDAVLDAPNRHTILQASADYWNQQEQAAAAAANDNDTSAAAASTTSRFTLQSANKREVHASDLNVPAIQAINQALTESIFPLLRDAFWQDIRGDALSEKGDDEDSMLLLYDALIIEYDATTLEGLGSSNVHIRERPSQPLHRDLGVLSVNIALDDPAQFQGGGTVFEKLLLSQPPSESSSSSDNDDADVSTMFPRAAGHAVAHPSRERHAGGALISGRRTILVMFVTVTNRDRRRRDERMAAPHPLEAAARCKILGMKLSQPDSQVKVPDSSVPPLQGKKDQIMCYRTAVRYDPSDGEAWLYLAMALQSDTSSDDSNQNLNEAIECLRTARKLNPNDGRVHNTLGIALQQRLRSSNIPRETEDRQLLLQDEIMESFCTAAKLHSRAASAGCQGAAAEARSALLNWGLYHANRDEFEKAVPILRQVCLEGHVADTSLDDDTALQQEKESDIREQEARRIVRDAKSLLLFCEKQHAADASNTQTRTASPTRSDDKSSSFIVRLASDECDAVHIKDLTDTINAAYKIGEKGIIVDSNEHPFHRVTVDDVQEMMRDGKLLILTTTEPTVGEQREKVLGCVKVEAFQVQDPEDPLFGQTCGDWGCFAVALAAQHQGHGRRLVQAAEDYARNALGCTWLQLDLLSPARERHAHKDMLREWYTTRLGYQLKWVNDHHKSSDRCPKGELLLGVVRLATDADFTTYRNKL